MFSEPPGELAGNEPKSELARDLGDRIQSQNVPVGISDDLLKTWGGLREYEEVLVSENFNYGIGVFCFCGRKLSSD